MELNRSLIKQQARQLIQGRVFILFLIIFVVGLLSGGLSGFVSNIQVIPEIIKNPEGFQSFPANPEATTTYSGGFSFGGILTLVFLPLSVALAGMFLQFIRGTQFDLGSEFTFVFTKTFDKNYIQKFLLKLLVGLFTVLWSILFIIPGIVYHYKTYFVDFIMADNPELTWRETIELSKKMTNGHKGELFVFDLSFILWYMLVGVTFGIAGIYVFPYIVTAQALYYENFKQRALQTGQMNAQDFISNNEKMAQAYNSQFGGTYQQTGYQADPNMYQPPVQQNPYQPPVAPAQPQAPVQPQYQPPQPAAPVVPVAPAVPVEEAPAPTAEPVVEEAAPVAEEAPAAAPSEEFYTPPEDVKQYFTPSETPEVTPSETPTEE